MAPTPGRSHRSPVTFVAMIVLRLTVAGFLLVSAAAPSLAAQDNDAVNVKHQISAGSELENYLRYLQVMSRAADQPWSVRPFSPSQLGYLLERTEDHPWQRHYKLAPSHRFVEVGAISPKTTIFFNSSFPYGSNDGPVWVGRGFTYQIQAGMFARVGPVTLTLAPVAFRAENGSFAHFDTLTSCPPACATSSSVDRPERFGDRPYQRIDPGASSLQLDLPLISAGISTANEWWGPAQEYPIILGNNAPGFVHLFFQTRNPTPVWIGRVHARVIYGKLDQSAYSPVTGSRRYTSPLEPGTVRFAGGLLAVFEPRGVDGLELGFGRFFHFIWPELGIPPSFVRKPFGVLFRSNTGPTGIDENQLVSAFARWAFPRSGFEVYGEYGRDDNSYDNRDLLQEPDHARAYMLGFRKSYNVTDGEFSAIRGELVNFQTPTLVRSGRGEGVFYRHSFLRQGHTNRGQLLGADVGVAAAAASLVSWDRFSRGGRTTFSWERKIQKENGEFHTSGVVNPKGIDVWHALRAERTKFFRNVDLTGGVTVVKEFNRNFREDAWNFNATLAAQYHLR